MNKLTKNLYCVSLRNGVEMWLEQDRIQELQKALSALKGSIFVNIGEETINTADLIGIFKGETMDEVRRRKNGQWKCKSSKWHDRGEKCNCPSIESQEREKRRTDAIRACGKCIGGYIHNGNTVRQCECISAI